MVRLCRRNYVAGASFCTAGLQSIVALYLCQGVCCIVFSGVKVSSLLSFASLCVLLLLTAIVARILYRWMPFSCCVVQRELWAYSCSVVNTVHLYSVCCRGGEVAR